MIQWVRVENLQQGMQKKQKGREEGRHRDRLVHTSLLHLQGKKHWGMDQQELLGQKETVQLDRRLGHQVAVLELLRVDTAQGTAQGTDQGLQDWRGTAPELQVDTVLESQDRGGIHQELKEVLGTALVPQDRSKMGTVELLAQMIQQSHREQRAGWVLPVLSLAILDLQELGGFQQELWD